MRGGQARPDLARLLPRPALAPLGRAGKRHTAQGGQGLAGQAFPRTGLRSPPCSWLAFFFLALESTPTPWVSGALSTGGEGPLPPCKHPHSLHALGSWGGKRPGRSWPPGGGGLFRGGLAREHAPWPVALLLPHWVRSYVSPQPQLAGQRTPHLRVPAAGRVTAGPHPGMGSSMFSSRVEADAGRKEGEGWLGGPVGEQLRI